MAARRADGSSTSTTRPRGPPEPGSACTIWPSIAGIRACSRSTPARSWWRAAGPIRARSPTRTTRSSLPCASTAPRTCCRCRGACMPGPRCRPRSSGSIRACTSSPPARSSWPAWAELRRACSTRSRRACGPTPTRSPARAGTSARCSIRCPTAGPSSCCRSVARPSTSSVRWAWSTPWRPALPARAGRPTGTGRAGPR